MYSFLTLPYYQGGDWDVTTGASIRCSPMRCENHLSWNPWHLADLQEGIVIAQ